MTQATDKGIIAGKIYTITGPADIQPGVEMSSNLAIGDKVAITEDDRTHMPYFKKVDAEGKPTGNQMLININRVTFEEVLPTPVTPLPYEVTVRKTDLGTMFFVARQLSKQEIAAVFALLNN